jgi:hypothetical protein
MHDFLCSGTDERKTKLLAEKARQRREALCPVSQKMLLK